MKIEFILIILNEIFEIDVYARACSENKLKQYYDKNKFKKK